MHQIAFAAMNQHFCLHAAAGKNNLSETQTESVCVFGSPITGSNPLIPKAQW